MTEHLTCKICGYKQYDPQTVQVYRERFPGIPEHDIPYTCGACLDQEENEEAGGTAEEVVG